MQIIKRDILKTKKGSNTFWQEREHRRRDGEGELDVSRGGPVAPEPEKKSSRGGPIVPEAKQSPFRGGPTVPEAKQSPSRGGPISQSRGGPVTPEAKESPPRGGGGGWAPEPPPRRPVETLPLPSLLLLLYSRYRSEKVLEP